MPAGQLLHALHVVSKVPVHAADWYEPALHVVHDWQTVLDPTVQAAATNSSAPHVAHVAHTVSAFAEHVRLAHVLPATQDVQLAQAVSEDKVHSEPMY